MAQKMNVLVDTDILIKVYKGDFEKERQLSLLATPILISSITAIELTIGLQSRRRMLALKKQLKSYTIIEVTDQISRLAKTLAFQYNIEHTLFVADSIIAATTINHKFQLFTDNKKDFKFIEGIDFYEP